MGYNDQFTYTTMKKSIHFFALVIFSFFMLSHTHQQAVWQEYHTSEELNIHFKSFQCIDEINGTDHNYILLRFENKTNEKLSISYKQDLWYDDVCVNCESTSQEHIKTIVLNPKEVIEGACFNNSAFKIFQNMPSGLTKRSLTKFELNDIRSTTQK